MILQAVQFFFSSARHFGCFLSLATAAATAKSVTGDDNICANKGRHNVRRAQVPSPRRTPPGCGSIPLFMPMLPSQAPRLCGSQQCSGAWNRLNSTEYFGLVGLILKSSRAFFLLSPPPSPVCADPAELPASVHSPPTRGESDKYVASA